MKTIHEIYAGSDGDATKALYERLAHLGACGLVARELFRAQKASARAKIYRGGQAGKSFKSMAYDKKEWAIGQLANVLLMHGPSLAIRWGWQPDPETPGYPWVLYVNLPTGQVSFHAPTRGRGPDYPTAWDGVVNASVGRILRWCEQLLAGAEARHKPCGS